MLIFYSEDLTITGYQTFPETSKAPHIEAPDYIAEQLKPLIGYAKLIDNGGTLQLPDNMADIAAEKAAEDLTAEVRAKRDGMLAEFDKITTNPLRWADLSDEQKQACTEYRWALLDVPQQDGFPADVIWPVTPEV